MAKVKNGDTVKVEYALILSDGRVVEETRKDKPLSFTVGADQIISGFDSAVVGMSVGEDKTVNLKAEEAYGKRDEDMVRAIPLKLVPKDRVPKKGQVLSVETQNGKISAKVVSVDDKFIVLDANHPMAGKDVSFYIKLIGIEPKKKKEKDAS
jgi:peptidylprolyl isomerase